MPQLVEQPPQIDDGAMRYGSARTSNVGPMTATGLDASAPLSACSTVTSAY